MLESLKNAIKISSRSAPSARDVLRDRFYETLAPTSEHGASVSSQMSSIEVTSQDKSRKTPQQLAEVPPPLFGAFHTQMSTGYSRTEQFGPHTSMAGSVARDVETTTADDGSNMPTHAFTLCDPNPPKDATFVPNMHPAMNWSGIGLDGELVWDPSWDAAWDLTYQDSSSVSFDLTEGAAQSQTLNLGNVGAIPSLSRFGNENMS